MKNSIGFVLICLGLAACGSSGGGAGSPASAASSNKSLFSKWIPTNSQSGTYLDLTNGSFSQAFSLIYTVSVSGNTNAQCQCETSLTGNQSSGTFVEQGCSYIGGGSGDPGCSQLDTAGLYSNNGTQLQICSGAGSSQTCTNYN
jgi:hypothetical protein